MSCEVHVGKMHLPAPLGTPDLHHVLPREWQRAWKPATAPYPGTYAGEAVWDARGVLVPSTCHHNVHFWIVAIMHAIADTAAPGPLVVTAVVDAAVKRVATAHNVKAGTNAALELATAAQAPLRFLAAGGDLRVLVDGHLWGAI